MSLGSFFDPQALRLLKEHWKDPQMLAEEIYAIMATTAPVKLNGPLRFERADGYTGPMFEFVDGDGPTISITGGNSRTDINQGGINHSSNLTLNTNIEESDPFIIQEGTGNTSGGTYNPTTTYIGVPTLPGVPQGPGQENKSQSTPGRITGGSGKTYSVAYYANGPYEAVTETLHNVECLGADDLWEIKANTWVDVRKSGDRYYFLQPPISITRKMTIDTVVGDTFWGLDADSNRYSVAKPYLLRKTPFDGEEHNGISYTYTGNSTRTAERGSDEEDQRS